MALLLPIQTGESKCLLESACARTSQYSPVPLSISKSMPSRMVSPSGPDVEEVPLRKLSQRYSAACWAPDSEWPAKFRLAVCPFPNTEECYVDELVVTSSTGGG
ncbi:hypothetical protein Ancab_009834 [Ancistrocladus abbreviatus]